MEQRPSSQLMSGSGLSMSTPRDLSVVREYETRAPQILFHVPCKSHIQQKSRGKQESVRERPVRLPETRHFQRPAPDAMQNSYHFE